jgi:hypothetical protein
MGIVQIAVTALAATAGVFSLKRHRGPRARAAREWAGSCGLHLRCCGSCRENWFSFF